jgi:cell wall-associated NlpC family hydrolase
MARVSGRTSSQVQPGDPMFFAGADGTLTAPGHVGIILRPGVMIDAPTTGQDIQIQAYGPAGLTGFSDPAAAGT